ncbi:MAG: DUF547 domain-containing protein, partial [Flavobacteriaceae bacterium]
MNLICFFLLGTLFTACNGNTIQDRSRNTLPSDSVAFTTQTSRPDHTPWNELLKKHVDIDGNVNYSAFGNDLVDLNAYLKHLSKNAPTPAWDKNEKLAYYINLYNAATVKLILDNYPTESIKDIPNRWKKNWIYIGKEITSLNDIEHEI